MLFFDILEEPTDIDILDPLFLVLLTLELFDFDEIVHLALLLAKL